MFNLTQSTLSSSTEKLSSGYKINRAADDAAGLSISEKMRKQIRGLTQASTNAEDGISAVQTAEGALSEVTDMLQRMNELATKAANGTNAESDRQTIQDEIEQLTTEIDRVAETTKFNEMYLLKGNADGTKSKQLINAHDAGLAGKLTDNGNGTATFELEEALKDGDKVTIAGKEYTIGASDNTGKVLDPLSLNTDTTGYSIASAMSSIALTAGDTVTRDGVTYTLTDKVAADSVAWDSTNTFTIGDEAYSVSTGTTASDNKYSVADATDLIKQAIADGKQVTATKYTMNQMDAASGANAASATSSALTNSAVLVDELDKNEISTASLKASTVLQVGEYIESAGKGNTATDTTNTLTAGDSVVVGGVKTTATEATPTAAFDVYTAINALVKDNTVTLGSGQDAKTYTIVDSADDEDEDGYKLTKESILAKIQDGDTVNYTGATAKVTVIGDIGTGDSSSSSDTISAEEAYKLMADALQQASSIGTDEGSEASVVNKGNGTFTITQGSAIVKDDLSFNLHVGADADMTNKITVNIGSMSAAGLGIQNLNVKDNSGAAATYAIDAIEDAINTVSAQRSLLGAVQNRLDHTINNLDNVVENTTSAESEIRDTDMATEMVKYSNANILSQAGQSMLAQANQSNQGVLSLLG
jgi:flagellin-like hook-associated protein FlgL